MCTGGKALWAPRVTEVDYARGRGNRTVASSTPSDSIEGPLWGNRSTVLSDTPIILPTRSDERTGAPVAKDRHEFRDPVHDFVVVSSDERRIVDSRPVQRLREIHQLAMSYLVYPGATHRRFEHSLGVMELAGQIFDALVDYRHLTDAIRDALPALDSQQTLDYYRQVVRLAGLLHDVGHLPFSHAAEEELLPEGRSHEHLTVDLILGEELEPLLEAMVPPVSPQLVAKVAVGPKHWTGERLGVWEALLSDTITHDVFGADRMDYLLRDSLHAGVAYGRYDLHRLVQSLRILLPLGGQGEDEGPSSPVVGINEGGLHSAEALLLARYFMFTQVYFHRVRCMYDEHLLDFLREWLPHGEYPDSPEDHLAITDSEVSSAMRARSTNPASDGHDPARRVVQRDHFRRLYEPRMRDRERHLDPAGAVADWARSRYGDDKVRRVRKAKDPGERDFPVSKFDETTESSLTLSKPLAELPPALYDGVFVDSHVHVQAQQDLDDAALSGVLGTN